MTTACVRQRVAGARQGGVSQGQRTRVGCYGGVMKEEKCSQNWWHVLVWGAKVECCWPVGAELLGK